MLSDFTLELAAADEALELPWAAPDGACRFLDLRRHPELLLELPEGAEHPELAEFLAAVNDPRSLLQSAKCDVWSTEELNEEELIFGAARKFASYVDLFFVREPDRFPLPRHEQFARQLVELLGKAPEIPAAVEVAIRRCYYHRDWDLAADSDAGFYFTLYVSGYGDDVPAARRSWMIALKLSENALAQLSRRGFE